MRTASRSAFIFFTLLAAGIAVGCSSGGSSGGAGPVPTPTQQPPLVFPSTTPGPQTTSFFPVPVPTATFFFTYKGEYQTGVSGPTPDPSATPTPLFLTSDTDLFGPDAAFNPGFGIPPVGTGVYDDHITSVVTGAGLFTTVTDNYYSLTRATPPPNALPNSTVVSLVGSVQFSPLGGSTQTEFISAYGPQSGVLDVIPEPSNQSQNNNPVNVFNEDATLTTIEVDADLQQTERITNPDGTYVENVTFPDFTTAKAQMNADGSGTYQYPYQLGGTANVSFSAPSGGQITVTSDIPGQGHQVVQIPQWYPNPLQIYKQAFLNFGPTALPDPLNTFSIDPPDCGFQQGLTEIQAPDGQNIPANLVTKGTISYDTVFGEQIADSVQSFRAPGFPNICEFDNNTVTSWYDYSQTPPIFSNTGALFVNSFQKVNSIVQETFNLSGQSKKRRGLQSRGGHVLGKGSPALAHGGFQAMGFHSTLMLERERQRIKRHAAMWRKLHAAFLKHRHH